VCESRDVGGLGIIDIKVFNMALLGKWIWWLGSSNGGLWKEILESKYGGWRFLKQPRMNNCESLWWRDLKEIWKLEEWGRSFEDCFKWEVGSGKDISF